MLVFLLTGHQSRYPMKTSGWCCWKTWKVFSDYKYFIT